MSCCGGTYRKGRKSDNNMANVITGIRIVCAAAILFFRPLSPAFYALYVAALVAACLIKLIPVLEIPVWLSVWIGAIALIKLTNIAYGYAVKKKLIAAHTVMNRLTGVLLFILPLTLRIIDLRISGSLVCAIATFAAVQEGCYIRTGRES